MLLVVNFFFNKVQPDYIWEKGGLCIPRSIYPIKSSYCLLTF